MNINRPVFICCLAAMVLGVFYYEMIQNQNWYDQQYDESRKVEDKQIVGEDLSPGNSNEPAVYKGKTRQELKALQTAARAQWDLAEWHSSRGEWDLAEKEYRRYIEEFPYVDLDYGYRTDDATQRLRDIQKMRQMEQAEKNDPFQ